MPEQQILRFRTADGLRLAGTLHLPDQLRPPVVVGCHGLLANRNSPKQIGLARACNREGIAYLRFDHRGCGDSEGDFKKVTSLEGRCRDLRAAVAAVREHEALGPLLAFFGSSFGGTVVLALAADLHAAAAVVTYAAPAQSSAISASAITGPDGRTVPEGHLPDGLRFDITAKLPKVHNLLTAHGRDDEIVPLAQAQLIHRLAGSPKKLLIQESGDHRMSDPQHQAEFEREFLAWLDWWRNLRRIQLPGRP